jgi:hypothetical protein
MLGELEKSRRWQGGNLMIFDVFVTVDGFSLKFWKLKLFSSCFPVVSFISKLLMQPKLKI